MEKLKNKRKSGFTLIELIIAISIIALLSGISVFALNDARVSGRDAKRKGDLSQIASGLELYKADLNVYPDSITVGSSLSGGGNIYIEVVPDDPNSSNNYLYVPTDSSGNSCTGNCVRFKIWAHLEGVTTAPTNCGTVPSGCGEACNFCITNP